MTSEYITDGLRDVATGILTPFDQDLEVDHQALQENARALYDRGVRTFLACGNVSEYHALSHEERIAVTESSVEALPNDAFVLAGAGGSTKTTIDLGIAFAEAGVDVLMVMPPWHTYKTEAGLLTYYRKVGKAVDIPLVPYVRGFDPSVEFLAELTQLDTVAGVKWTLEDVPQFAAAVEAGADDIVWMNGLGEAYAVSLHIHGAEGHASGVGNFEPAISMALFAALTEEDWQRARAIQRVAVPFMEFREESGEGNVIPHGNSIPAVKAGLEFAGLTGGPVREPIDELSESDRARARELYDNIARFIEQEL